MKSKVVESYKKDFWEILCSSKRKIVKSLAVLFIPFVYAFICIAAFWNPLSNIGKVPVAIVNCDTSATPPQAGGINIVDNLMGM
jgi:putative membrane protein